MDTGFFFNSRITWDKRSIFCDFKLKVEELFTTKKVYEDATAAMLGIKPEDNEVAINTGSNANVTVNIKKTKESKKFHNHILNKLNSRDVDYHRLTLHAQEREKGFDRVILWRARPHGIVDRTFYIEIIFHLLPKINKSGRIGQLGRVVSS